MINLNNLLVPTNGAPGDLGGRLERWTHNGADGDVEVVFDNVVGRLCHEIRQHEVVIGCMAWLTNQRVLHALATCKGVSIVVQKEDFLRPDSNGLWKEDLRRLYRVIPGMERPEVGGGHLSCAGAYEMDAVRCAGIRPEQRTVPKMHHKFLLFGRPTPFTQWELPQIELTKVWTGSFNASHNAEQSLENAVLIERKFIVDKYHAEYLHVLGLSEPLDWQSVYVEPEWRVGT